MAAIKHFAAPAGMTTPPLSFAARTGDLLFVSGIPGFDENGKLPDDFEAQFGFVVRNIKRVLGYNLYQTKKQPEGLQINVGPSGLKIQNK